LILQTDFAGVPAGKSAETILRIETFVAIEPNIADTVRFLLASPSDADRRQLKDVLISLVPVDESSEEDQRKAKHMIAAALGFEFP
jgi:hypothetical protein